MLSGVRIDEIEQVSFYTYGRLRSLSSCCGKEHCLQPLEINEFVQHRSATEKLTDCAIVRLQVHGSDVSLHCSSINDSLSRTHSAIVELVGIIDEDR